jgi:hypothetical protein
MMRFLLKKYKIFIYKGEPYKSKEDRVPPPWHTERVHLYVYDVL